MPSNGNTQDGMLICETSLLDINQLSADHVPSDLSQVFYQIKCSNRSLQATYVVVNLLSAKGMNDVVEFEEFPDQPGQTAPPTKEWKQQPLMTLQPSYPKANPHPFNISGRSVRHVYNKKGLSRETIIAKIVKGISDSVADLDLSVDLK